jgi:iron-sulfur cluster assembly protein
MGKETSVTSTIEITEKARGKLLNLNVTRENFLRLWVSEGGCHGMSYQAALDNAQTPFDVVLYEDEQIRIVSDKTSAGVLGGLKVDYTDDLVRSGFKFENPNATSTCGCGHSFQT